MFDGAVGLTLYEAWLLVPAAVPDMVLMPLTLLTPAFRLLGAVPVAVGIENIGRPVPEAGGARVGWPVPEAEKERVRTPVPVEFNGPVE